MRKPYRLSSRSDDIFNHWKNILRKIGKAVKNEGNLGLGGKERMLEGRRLRIKIRDEQEKNKAKLENQ